MRANWINKKRHQICVRQVIFNKNQKILSRFFPKFITKSFFLFCLNYRLIVTGRLYRPERLFGPGGLWWFFSKTGPNLEMALPGVLSWPLGALPIFIADFHSRLLPFLQWWAKYLDQSKELKKSWAKPKTIDICFCFFFHYCCCSFVSKREAGH